MSSEKLGMPLRTCGWCGLIGKHRTKDECIANLRDRIAYLEFQRDRRASSRPAPPAKPIVRSLDPKLNSLLHDSYFRRERDPELKG